MHLMRQAIQGVDRWLFASCAPIMCSVLRIAYASMLLIYIGMWLREAEFWFSDTGVLRAQTMNQINSGGYASLLFWLPTDSATVRLLLIVLWMNALLLLLGCWSKFQIICIFVGLVSFQHRNTLICDGQDVLVRLLAFYMIFLPLDYAWSLGRKLAKKPRVVSERADRRSAWGLRLIQFQLTVIYVSTAWEKLQGISWRDGTALFYVARMDDLFGRFWIPDFLFETPEILHAMTWSVIAFEGLLPLFLWIPRTRPVAVALGILFHLSIEYAMHIFLFEWFMIISLLSFVGSNRPTLPRTTSNMHAAPATN